MIPRLPLLSRAAALARSEDRTAITACTFAPPSSMTTTPQPQPPLTAATPLQLLTAKPPKTVGDLSHIFTDGKLRFSLCLFDGVCCAPFNVLAMIFTAAPRLLLSRTDGVKDGNPLLPGIDLRAQAKWKATVCNQHTPPALCERGSRDVQSVMITRVRALAVCFAGPGCGMGRHRTR